MLAVVLPVLVLVFCFPSVVARLSEGSAFLLKPTVSH